MSNDNESIDAASLSLDELRDLRSQMQQRDDVVSYARRVAQARLDLVKSELVRRHSDGNVECTRDQKDRQRI